MLDNKETNINNEKNKLILLQDRKIAENNKKIKIKKIIKFIYIFIIIGFESIGNMSAVTAVLEDNLIKKNKLVTEEDIIDSITIARMGPGAITANAVAYLGNKIYGFWGGVVAGLCYTIGPLIILLIIYPIIEKVITINYFSSALKGGLACISIIFINSIYEMGKKILKEKKNIFIFFLSIILIIIFKMRSIIVVLFSIIIRFNYQ